MHEICRTGRKDNEWKGYPDFQHKHKQFYYEGTFFELLQWNSFIKDSLKQNWRSETILQLGRRASYDVLCVVL
jgi:hypothetical protein